MTKSFDPSSLVNVMPTGGRRSPNTAAATIEPTVKTTVTRTVRITQLVPPATNEADASSIQKVALFLCEEALVFHLEVLRDPSASLKDRQASANVILDRGLGKAQQVATVHGQTTQVQVSAADYLAALKSPKTIDATPKDLDQ